MHIHKSVKVKGLNLDRDFSSGLLNIGIDDEIQRIHANQKMIIKVLEMVGILEIEEEEE